MTFDQWTGFAGFFVLLGLLFCRLPVANALLITGGGGILFLAGPRVLLIQLQDLAYAQFSLYSLSVIPFFVLMGQLAARSGLSSGLFRGTNALFGRLRGGLALAVIGTSAGFGAVCGSSLATCVSVSKIAYQELRSYAYAPSLTTGVLAAGGTLGILIPPSLVLVLYAILVEVNLAKMFAAAFVPAFLAVVFFATVVFVQASLRPGLAPARGPWTRAAVLRGLTGLLAPFCIFAIVMGGIFGGFFNPTPAAAFGAFLVLCHGVVRQKLGREGLSWHALRAGLLETAQTTAMIYYILLGASLFNIFMVRSHVPDFLAEWVAAADVSPYGVLLLCLGGLVALGCVMESLSLILLAVPLLWPVLTQLDFGMEPELFKLWFGVLALVVVEIGLITPPFGLNVFTIHSVVREVPLRVIFLGVLPFVAVEVVRVVVLVLFPELTTAFPVWLYGS